MRPVHFIAPSASARAARVIAGLALVAGGLARPTAAAAQLLPVTIDADADTQCAHLISRADFSAPAPLRRGDRRLFRALRLQYETTARIAQPRVFTIATDAAPLHYVLARPTFFYFRPWATPPEFLGFARLEIPADVPVGAIAVDATQGGCASAPVNLNELAAAPRNLAEVAPTALAPIFPAETAAPNNGPVARRAASRAPVAHAFAGPRPARSPIAAERTPTRPLRPAASQPVAARSVAPSPVATVSVATAPTATPRPAAGTRATPCVTPDREPRVVSSRPVNAREKGKPINDRPTVGRVRVALRADGTVRKAEIAESSGFALLDTRMRESAARGVYAPKVEACEAVPSDYVVRYEIGF